MMGGRRIDLVLLPTLRCNADCAYCFENKGGTDLSLEDLSVLVRRVVEYMTEMDIEALTINWQGGEALMMSPAWFEEAHRIIDEAARAGGKTIENRLQSNLIGYDSRWNGVIAEVFGGSIGSSLDYPNLHRKVVGGAPEEFNRRWLEGFRLAREAGIHVGVIAIPNDKTLSVGAEAFYTYFVDELGVTDFQINTPFAGGRRNATKDGFPLDPVRLGRFLSELADVWLDRGCDRGVRIGPFDQLAEHFMGRSAVLPCIWLDTCADRFICIDPAGNVSQCDCWVTSYPDYRFGNIVEEASLGEMLHRSAARRSLRDRPGSLIKEADCIECDYLGLCHGGCPIRAYATGGSLLAKDPYCETYRTLFAHVQREVAPRLASRNEALETEGIAS